GDGLLAAPLGGFLWTRTRAGVIIQGRNRAVAEMPPVLRLSCATGVRSFLYPEGRIPAPTLAEKVAAVSSRAPCVSARGRKWQRLLRRLNCPSWVILRGGRCGVNFSEQPPSKQWAALKYRGEKIAEVWFKPEDNPFALTIRIPQKSFQ